MRRARYGKRQHEESLSDSARTVSALGSVQYLTRGYHTPVRHLGAITHGVRQDTLSLNRQHFVTVLAARL